MHSIRAAQRVCQRLFPLQSEANLDVLNGGLNGADKGIAALDMNGDAAKKASILDSQRAVTGVLTSRPTSRDIKIDGFSMSLNGIELIQDCAIELTIGRRYGLIGANGSGKTNFLQCLANREVRQERVARRQVPHACLTSVFEGCAGWSTWPCMCVYLPNRKAAS